MERIAQAQTEDRQAQRQMSIHSEQVPETVIGRALTCGGNRQHSIERIVAFFQNLGGCIGSAAFGALAVSMGWNMASLAFCVPIAIVGGVCAVLIKSLKAKNDTRA